MIVIIGAGISGLTLAYELQKRNIEYILLEASGKAGGVIDSVETRGYLLEKGPATLMADKTIKNFLTEIGLLENIVYPQADSKNRFIFKNGEYRKLPSSPTSFLIDNFFSFKTKLAVLKEFRKGPSDINKNETISEFFERRFNREIVNYLIDPLVSGIYAGDPEKLLLRKTFPFLHSLEEKYGSVLKGFIKSKSSANRKETLSFKKGMKTLTDALSEKLKFIRYNTKVEVITKDFDGFRIHFQDSHGKHFLRANKVVLSSPAWTAGTMVQEIYPSFANALEKIKYAPLVKVFTAFKRKDVKHPLNGYGGLNPSCENQFILGSLWNSSVYPHTCRQGEVLFTSMIGGIKNNGNTEFNDQQIISKVIRDLKQYYQIKSNPVFDHLHRIPKAIPQFDIHVLPIDTYAKELENKGFHICSNWKDGAAIGDCIKKAINLAKILEEKQVTV